MSRYPDVPTFKGIPLKNDYGLCVYWWNPFNRKYDFEFLGDENEVYVLDNTCAVRPYNKAELKKIYGLLKGTHRPKKHKDTLTIKETYEYYKDMTVFETFQCNGRTQQMFWCPYCKVWHYHGTGAGSRTPHCMFHKARGETLKGEYAIGNVSKEEALHMIRIMEASRMVI